MDNNEVIRYRQAAEFTSFHKKLGVLLTPYLDARWSMADIGCGLALIDFEIASCVKSIDAIDIDAELIEEVREKIEDELWQEYRHAEAITPVVADSRHLGDAAWDIVMTCFYSVPFEELADLMARARRRVILIVHGRKPNGRFDLLAEEAKKMTADDLEQYLTRSGCKYKKTVAELQFGQPFKTIEEIHAFLDSFPGSNAPAPEIPDPSDTAFPTPEDVPAIGDGFDPEKYALSAEERIIKTNRYDYPYYLPRSLNVAIFIVVK